MPAPRKHYEELEACPFLPVARQVLRASVMKEFGAERGADFYERALECAQSLWLQGLPAQALLLINRALGARVCPGEAVLERCPLPYEAAAWVMLRRDRVQFIGNPRRHYQHLATRMVEPRIERRRWRAWACWAMACRIFPDFPADEKQITEEGIEEPGDEKIREGLERFGIEGEVSVWERGIALCGEG